MFLSEWSGQFVHGPDSIGFPILLAEANLLKPGERIRAIPRVTWRRPMTNDLTLAVYAQEFTKRPTAADPYAFDGQLQTTLGRTLSFYGIENGDPIRRQSAVPNPYAKALFCNCPRCYSRTQDGEHSFRLKDGFSPEHLGVLNGSAAVSAAALLELIVKGLVAVGMECDGDRVTSAHVGLLGQVSNLEIPEDFADILGGEKCLRLRGLRKRIRSSVHTSPTAEPLSLVSFEYSFPGQTNFSHGIAAAEKDRDL